MRKRIFTLAWEFPPIMSGESVVCFRTLFHSTFCYDVCSGRKGMDSRPWKPAGNIRAYPLKGKYAGWPFRAAGMFQKLDKLYDYDVVLSRVMPPNGHLAGLFVKLLKPRIKWAVYFSDPVWNSPFISFRSVFEGKKTQRPNYFLMKLFGIPAKLAIRFGDLLVFNNERLARYVLGKKYGKYQSKTVIAPYGLEQVDSPPPRQKEPGSPVTFAHVGQIYGNRTLSVLIAALERLRERDPASYERIRIRQVGFLCDSERKAAEESRVAGCFCFEDEVDYTESLQAMREADCLLIIDPVFKRREQNLYVPAKLFDYMSTGKPFAAICDGDSATADIIGTIPGGRMAAHDPEAVCKMLEGILQDGVPEPDLDAYRRFSCIHGVRAFDEAVRQFENGERGEGSHCRSSSRK